MATFAYTPPGAASAGNKGFWAQVDAGHSPNLASFNFRGQEQGRIVLHALRTLQQKIKRLEEEAANARKESARLTEELERKRERETHDRDLLAISNAERDAAERLEYERELAQATAAEQRLTQVEQHANAVAEAAAEARQRALDAEAAAKEAVTRLADARRAEREAELAAKASQEAADESRREEHELDERLTTQRAALESRIRSLEVTLEQEKTKRRLVEKRAREAAEACQRSERRLQEELTLRKSLFSNVIAARSAERDVESASERDGGEVEERDEAALRRDGELELAREGGVRMDRMWPTAAQAGWAEAHSPPAARVKAASAHNGYRSVTPQRRHLQSTSLDAARGNGANARGAEADERRGEEAAGAGPSGFEAGKFGGWQDFSGEWEPPLRLDERSLGDGNGASASGGEEAPLLRPASAGEHSGNYGSAPELDTARRKSLVRRRKASAAKKHSEKCHPGHGDVLKDSYAFATSPVPRPKPLRRAAARKAQAPVALPADEREKRKQLADLVHFMESEFLELKKRYGSGSSAGAARRNGQLHVNGIGGGDAAARQMNAAVRSLKGRAAQLENLQRRLAVHETPPRRTISQQRRENGPVPVQGRKTTRATSAQSGRSRDADAVTLLQRRRGGS